MGLWGEMKTKTIAVKIEKSFEATINIQVPESIENVDIDQALRDEANLYDLLDSEANYIEEIALRDITVSDSSEEPILKFEELKDELVYDDLI